MTLSDIILTAAATIDYWNGWAALGIGGLAVLGAVLLAGDR